MCPKNQVLFTAYEGIGLKQYYELSNELLYKILARGASDSELSDGNDS